MAEEKKEKIIDYRITFYSDIDFFDEQLKIFIKIPKHYLKKKQLSAKNNPDDETLEIINFNKESYLIINEKFKIADDYNSVMVRGNTYHIPDFFNTKTVKSCDKKTWEMIFYQIFANEITEHLKEFKNIFGEKY